VQNSQREEVQWMLHLREKLDGTNQLPEPSQHGPQNQIESKPAIEFGSEATGLDGFA